MWIRKTCLWGSLWLGMLAVVLAGPPVFPDQLTLSSGAVTKLGQGTRKKFFIKLYDAALYAPSGQLADQVATADVPSLVRLSIRSSLITASKMRNAIREGFVASTNGDTTALDERIEQLTQVFEELSEGQIIDFVYRPGAGTEVRRDGAVRTLIPGADFKTALLNIWIGPAAVQESLREQMLGRE